MIKNSDNKWWITCVCMKYETLESVYTYLCFLIEFMKRPNFWLQLHTRLSQVWRLDLFQFTHYLIVSVCEVGIINTPQSFRKSFPHRSIICQSLEDLSKKKLFTIDASNARMAFVGGKDSSVSAPFAKEITLWPN